MNWSRVVTRLKSNNSSYRHTAIKNCKLINGFLDHHSPSNIILIQTHPPQLFKYFSTSTASYCSPKGPAEDENRKTSAIVTQKYFEHSKDDKSRESFEGAIDIFTDKDTRRRGSVEFIYAAMRNMEKFGVHKDLGSYKKLMDVFPKGKMIPENRLQGDFFHYPKQQQCATTLLHKMEQNKVIPDEEMGDILLNVFGKYATPYKRYCRMMYWMPKFKNLSPFPLPDELPNEALELAKLAIKQITSVDPSTRLDIINTEDVPDSNDQTWVVSGQSFNQEELLEDLKAGTPLYVEGAFRVWLKEYQVSYFILRGPPIPAPPTPPMDNDELNIISRWMDGEKSPAGTVVKEPTVHEQEDGTILAVCATGSSSRDSLLSWIRTLETTNPNLANMAVLFTLTSPLGPVIPVKDETSLSFK
eukprot:GFUD01036949.1.p1 GENE.GFUD01036949.1~~GFUD01036949.1.p1  ORF type:complete len:414 (+),score=96.86 GFUD01036949.1:55-1296(+)